MQLKQCMCHLFGPMEIATRVVLVTHHTDVDRPTNTGRLALRGFTNTALYVRGRKGEVLDLSAVSDPARRLWLLFPAPGARLITPEAVAEDPRPITLVVPDGTWPQARRVVNKEELLRDAAAFVPPNTGPSRYHVRRKHLPQSVATAEAIARALGVIEGPQAQAHLENLFEHAIDRIFASRGTKRPVVSRAQ